ncbi:MAG: hypothetical protein Q7S66_05310 [bacterium]|nr:hypothetical protein [bacterium]
MEGLATARYRAKGFIPYFEGTVNFEDQPFEFDAEALVREINPDTVIVTMSSPINIEDSIGLAANNFGIPLITVSDYWGSLTRAKKCKADLMLAIDDADADIARRHFIHTFDIAIVGNHAIQTLRKLAPSAEIKQKMAELKHHFGTIMLFAGGAVDYTTPEIKLLAECLKKTPGSWGLIKRYHPKHAERITTDGRIYRAVWDAEFAEFGDRVMELPTKEADAVASMADCTVSGFSTLMTSAVGSYRPVIALITPETIASLKAQTTLNRYPLSTAGLVPEVAEPCDLTPLLRQKPEAELINSILKPYDPALALAEIEKLLK